jgi:DNA-binding NarL/FixJ family response regulator
MWKGAVMANDNHGIAPAVRVLVVEDFEPFRRFVCSTLNARPYLQIIAEASNGLEAVRKAEKLQPELILLDIGLARLDGIEAARQIRKLSPQSKIIFVTQETDPDVVREAFKLGAAGYVVKTSIARDLLAAVDAVLDGRQFLSVGINRASAAG